jgi:hypothetical protein
MLRLAKYFERFVAVARSDLAHMSPVAGRLAHHRRWHARTASRMNTASITAVQTVDRMVAEPAGWPTVSARVASTTLVIGLMSASHRSTWASSGTIAELADILKGECAGGWGPLADRKTSGV